MTNSTLQKQFIQSGAAFAGIAVVAGAFGSHWLKDVIDGNDRNMYEIAVRYQFYHSLAILAMGFGLRRMQDDVARVCLAFFIIGIFLFSGVLYLQSTSIVWAGVRIKWLGWVVPFGGLSFAIAWFYLAFKGYKPSSSISESSKKVMQMQKRKIKTDE